MDPGIAWPLRAAAAGRLAGLLPGRRGRLLVGQRVQELAQDERAGIVVNVPQAGNHGRRAGLQERPLQAE